VDTAGVARIMRERFPLLEEFGGTGKPVNRVEPRVSVQVTTYQHAPYIGRCLDGILMQQTSFPIEILVGDDESTDGTREICLRYAERHPDRIRLFLCRRELSHVPWHGNDIMLNGYWLFCASRGKYLAICEGDDYWTDPLKLEKQVDALERRPEVGLVHSDADYFFVATGQRIANYGASRGHRYSTSGEWVHDRFMASEYPIISCTVLFTRRLLDAIDYGEWLFFQSADTYLWMEFSRHAQFLYLPGSTAVRQLLRESVSQSADPRRILAFRLSGYALFRHFLQKYRHPDDAVRRIETACLKGIWHLALRAGRVDMAHDAYRRLRRVAGPSAFSPRERAIHAFSHIPLAGRAPGVARTLRNGLVRRDVR
jgi:glycosyltransferase involved in cell wall biosynthesis